ncbi:DNA polymerase III subunit delta [candidate division KSB3 bacterium]|jgi:DNA polymerase-3 subunit delta|nr:DNA polymerase III subunit delta [candidate division KSB3 bacterium]
MLYLLHGENDLKREEALASLIESTGLTDDLRDLNLETLSGPVTAGDLSRACDPIPFLGDARVVIVREGLKTLTGDAARSVAEYFEALPPTTHLAFVEEKKVSKRSIIYKALDNLNAKIKDFTLPNNRELPNWIVARTRSRGGRIDRRAAAQLAQNIGPKLRILDQEIQKLMLYVGEDGVIMPEDVQVMVPYIQAADVIFNMVDAVGQRNPQHATIYLHRLLDAGEHPLGIFGMVVRQFRLLMQVRWMLDHRHSEREIISRLSLHPYVAQKIRAQARRFTLRQLREAYRILMENDLSIKKGQISPESDLDLLMAQLTRL